MFSIGSIYISSLCSLYDEQQNINYADTFIAVVFPVPFKGIQFPIDSIQFR